MKNKKEAYTIKELAELVGGEVSGNSGLLISGVSGVDESTEETITFAEDKDYLKRAENSKAAALVVSRELTDSRKPLIRVDNPRLAFAKIAQLFQPDIFYSPGIADSSVIADTAVLGEEVSIHNQVVIEENARIGARVQLAPGVYIGKNVEIADGSIIHPNVVIEYGTVIGSGVIIHAGTVIGSDGYGYVSDEKAHHKIPQLGNVIIGDNVEIGANVTIDRGTSGPTVIGRGTKIDNLVQVAHNVKIGEENLIIALTGIAGSVSLGKRVTLAGQVGVTGHLTIGARAIIMADSIVTGDVPRGAVYSGNPAREHRKQLRQQAAARKIPGLLKKIRNIEERLEAPGKEKD